MITVTVTTVTQLADGTGYNVVLDVAGFGAILLTTTDASSFAVGSTWNVTLAPAS